MSDDLAMLTKELRAADEALRAKDTQKNRDREQRAFDALVDYVESNDMNYTEHDPRGPGEES